MLIVPYVCAEFHDRTGAVLHTIRPADLRTMMVVPDHIKQDPLFDMLVADGSLQVPDTKEKKQQLENDPDLKAPEAAYESSAAPAESKPSGRKTAEKKEQP